MLRLWIGSALGLSITLAVLLGAAIVLGFQQPASTWAQILHFDDCELPCWIGIQPGHTTLADADQKVEAVYGGSALYRLQKNIGYFALAYPATGQRMTIAFDTDSIQSSAQSVVQKINLWPDVTLNVPVSLAELDSRLGETETVRRSSIGGTPVLVLFHSDQHVGVVVDSAECNKVLPAQRIYIIVLSNQSLGDYFSWLSALAPWQGFQRCYDLAFTPHS